MNIVFLVSGNGGNLKFFQRVLNEQDLFRAELYVVADRECGAIVFARQEKIFEKVIHYSKNRNQELLQCLRELGPDIIITTWHKIIDEETVREYDGKLINLHYSLLPAFSGHIGTVPIEKAYEKGCRFVGATCHHVDDKVDNGKIISQAVVDASIPIDKAINEVFQKGCLLLLNSVMLVSGVSCDEDRSYSDGCFSPAIKFDTARFDAQFWDDIRSA